MTREDRLELIEYLKYNRSIGADYTITDEAADEIIKALEQESILDKIRMEIEDIYCGQYCENPMTAGEVREQVLDIIYKYSAESENEE